MVLNSKNSQNSQVLVENFSCRDRIKILATVCADGTCHNPIFVLIDDQLEHRFIDLDNRWEQDSKFD